MAEKFRLNKFISDSGVCSRREADHYIEQGHVFVNGKRAVIGTLVSRHDKVMLNGNLIEAKEGNDFVFIAFNKPVGIVSTTEIGVRDSIIDYIGYHERIFPIGRLDKDSQGLIFLTNNGDIVNKILRAGNRHEKEYIVTVNKPITDDFVYNMGNGVPILGEMTKKCKVSKDSVFSFRITLIQGLNRQIRRMCDYFGYEVVKLERIRIMNISLKGLPLGEWRQLEPEEMSQIMADIANSSSEVKPKNQEVKNRNNNFSEKNREQNAKTQQGAKTKGSEQKYRNTGSRAPEHPVRPSKKALDSYVSNPKAKELRSNTKKSGSTNKAKSGYGNSNRNKSGRR